MLYHATRPKPFGVVNGMYEECERPLIFHPNGQNSTLVKFSGETYAKCWQDKFLLSCQEENHRHFMFDCAEIWPGLRD